MARVLHPTFALAALIIVSAPLAAKDSLGVFSGWAAFRDIGAPRCYAIAKADLLLKGEGEEAEPVGPQATVARQYEPYASVGTWPRRQIRNQLHIRLSREIAKGAAISLRVGGRSFSLTGGGGDAWAANRGMDAAIVAAMRSAETMRISSVTTTGRRFTDTYKLAGAATAIDAATLGCSPAALREARAS